MVQLVISSAVHLQSALQSMLFKDDSGTGIVMNRVSPRYVGFIGWLLCVVCVPDNSC